MRTKTFKILLFMMLVFSLSLCLSQQTTAITCCGNTYFLYNNGKVNLTFVDSCITFTLLNYDTSDDYVYFDDLRLDTTSSNNIKINISELNSTHNLIKGMTVLRFNATYNAGSVNFYFKGNHTYACYDVAVDGIDIVDNSDRHSFSFNYDGWSTKDFDIEFEGFKPDPPKNLIGSISGYIINLTWTRTVCSDREVVMVKTGSYPNNVSDGTLLYNGTTQTFTISPEEDYYYSVFSYNVSTNVFSEGKDYYLVMGADNHSDFIVNLWNKTFSPYTDLFQKYVGNGNIFFLLPVIGLTMGIYVNSKGNLPLVSVFMLGTGALLCVGSLALGNPELALLFGIFSAVGLIPLFTFLFYGG